MIKQVDREGKLIAQCVKRNISFLLLLLNNWEIYYFISGVWVQDIKIIKAHLFQIQVLKANIKYACLPHHHVPTSL